MIDDKILNRSLKRQYGYQEGGQNFRLARTNDQTEWRKGTFSDFTSEGIYLRTVTEFRELPRYNYLGDRPYWVLERLYPVSEEIQKILGSKWTYEPLFVFINPETKEPLPVTKDIVHAFIQVSLYGPKRKAKTAEQLIAEEEEYYEKQSGLILQYLQDEIPSMAVQLKAGSAIVVP